MQAHAVYLSQYQLLPYERLREYFADRLGIPISSGSVYNFIAEAYEKAQSSGALHQIKTALLKEAVLHSDETGINIDGSQLNEAQS